MKGERPSAKHLKSNGLVVSRRTRIEELPEFLSPQEVSAFLKIGRTAIYEAIRRGELTHLRYGRIIRIPKAALQIVGMNGMSR